MQLALLSVAGMAQGKLKSFQTCTSADSVKKVYEGDTVIINCNNAFIINQTILDNYKKSIRTNANCNDVIKTYAALSNLQDSQIVIQNRRFDELKNKFDSLGNNTGQFLAITQGSLSEVSDTLSFVSAKLTETKQLLIDTQNLLAKEKEDRWKQKLRWGIGGFGVGLVVTTALFLIVR